MKYSDLHLDDNLQKGISAAGYISCTPVQEQVLNVSLDGSDLYVQSQTGTGKTAAYLISIMQEMLTKPEVKGKKALVMVPTRELAVQVETEAKKLGSFTSLVASSFYGGIGYDQQIASLKKGVDIIIGTPGRVIDLNESKHMDLSAVSFLVVDEADRMFDMGFYPDLRKLIQVLPQAAQRQTMLFSATLNSYVKNLAWEYTQNAKEITIEAENITVDEIDQELIHVSSDEKMRLLIGILSREKPSSVIIFCNTKRMCEVLSKRLKINGIESDFIIGDLPQSKRLKIMDNFKVGKVTCLVATDVAARGIDVNDLSMVVNYDLPNEAENYVHRIGRTARAGKSGKAYTFCSEQDVYSLVPIERYIEKQIPSRVAIESDFGEDKSKGTYIRTENWREEYSDHGKRDSYGSHGRSNKASHYSSDKSNIQRTKKTSGKSYPVPKGKNSKSRSPYHQSEKSTSSNFDSGKLSEMSFEERMKIYKQKYEHGKAPVNRTNGSDSRKKIHASSGNNKSNSRKMSVQTGSLVNKKSSPVQKKTGLFSKIRSLFGKK